MCGMTRFLLAACLLLLHAAAGALPERPAGAERPALKVALFDVPPYAHQVRGEARGHYVELVRRLLAEAGFSAQIQVLPFARLPVALAQREADLTMGFNTEALERITRPLLPVALVDAVVVARAARALPSLESLQGASVGRARGGCRELTTRSELQIRWTEVAHFDSALRMLDLGRLDAVCLTREVLRHELKTTGLDSRHFGSPLLLRPQTVWLLARKDLDAPVAAQLRTALGRRAPLRFD